VPLVVWVQVGEDLIVVAFWQKIWQNQNLPPPQPAIYLLALSRNHHTPRVGSLRLLVVGSVRRYDPSAHPPVITSSSSLMDASTAMDVCEGKEEVVMEEEHTQEEEERERRGLFAAPQPPQAPPVLAPAPAPPPLPPPEEKNDEEKEREQQQNPPPPPSAPAPVLPPPSTAATTRKSSRACTTAEAREVGAVRVTPKSWFPNLETMK
jgi:outer membrane biosynthesis protein TonB